MNVACWLLLLVVTVLALPAHSSHLRMYAQDSANDAFDTLARVVADNEECIHWTIEPCDTDNVIQVNKTEDTCLNKPPTRGRSFTVRINGAANDTVQVDYVNVGVYYKETAKLEQSNVDLRGQRFDAQQTVPLTYLQEVPIMALAGRYKLQFQYKGNWNGKKDLGCYHLTFEIV